MNQYETIFLDVNTIKDMGWDPEVMSITANKRRPFMVVASNAKMVWLVPLTTQFRGKHGRVAVKHVGRDGEMDCEAITTDMFPVLTRIVEAASRKCGRVSDGDKVVKQLQFSLECGRLGRQL